MSTFLTFYRLRRTTMRATEALAAARKDEAALGEAKAHYETCAASPENEAAFFAARRALGRARPALSTSPAASGLRFVGHVVSGHYGGRGAWDSQGRSGWYCDPSGDDTCQGVVYQLPARRGRARFLAGYEFSGCDGGPALDYSRIFEGEPDAPQDSPAAHAAARAADQLAAQAAEKERDWQIAWELGEGYAALAGEVARARKMALDLLAARRQVTAPPAICEAIRARIGGLVADIREARAAMRRYLQGDGPDGLILYMDERARETFAEAAGLPTFPQH